MWHAITLNMTIRTMSSAYTRRQEETILITA